MLVSNRWLYAVALAVALIPARSWAEAPADAEDDAPQPEQSVSAADEPTAAPASDEIRGWIKDLDNDKAAKREQASKKLTQAGKAVIEEVVKAAGSDSREVSIRAIEVLKQLGRSADAECKKQARAALEKLAEGDGAVARRAEQALKPEPEAPLNPGGGVPAIIPGGNIQIQGNIQIGGGAQIGGGGIKLGPQGQIQIQNGARMIKVQNINGKRSIEAHEDGKTVQIKDDPQGNIEMSITEKVNGQEKTEKFSAKNAEELKKQHPEAEKVYQKYAGPNAAGGLGAIQIQIQAGGAPGIQVVPPGILPPAVPNVQPPALPNIQPPVLPNVQPPAAPAPAARPLTPAERKQAADQVSEARKLVNEAAEQLKKQTGSSADADALKKAIDQLQEAERKLAEALDKLEG